MRHGGTSVIMEHFDPEEALALIEKHQLTHGQFVPTMFVRAKLPKRIGSTMMLQAWRSPSTPQPPAPFP